MTDQIMSVDALPIFVTAELHAQQVRVHKENRVITIEPLDEQADCTIGLRGMFKDCAELSVDKYLERKRTERELDL